MRITRKKVMTSPTTSTTDQYNILGIRVSHMSEEEAAKTTIDLLKNPKVAVIYMLTAESSLVCQTDDAAAAMVNACDLVLPGDLHTSQALLQIADPDGMTGTPGDEGEYIYCYIRELLPALEKEGTSIYAVMEKDQHLSLMQEFFLNEYPGISFYGTVVEKDTEGEASRVVNDINACLPDIVLLCVEIERQISFVRDYITMMNTKLCICMEFVNSMMSRIVTDVPRIFRKLHLEGLYHWFRKEHKLQGKILGSIFKRRLIDNAGANRTPDRD